MKKMKRSRLIYTAAAVLGLLFFVSCSLFESDEDCTPAPYDCMEDEPEMGDLILDVTLDQLNPVVPLVIYSGDMENGNVVIADTVEVNTVDYRLINGNYSVTAEYKIVKDSHIVTVFVLEGGKLKAKSEDYCEGTCYEEGKLNLDVTLDPDLF